MAGEKSPKRAIAAIAVAVNFILIFELVFLFLISLYIEHHEHHATANRLFNTCIQMFDVSLAGRGCGVKRWKILYVIVFRIREHFALLLE
jgi:hypothetical protein